MLEQFISLPETFLSQYWWFGNTLVDYVTAVVLFLLYLTVFKGVQSLILYRLKKLSQKTSTDIDDTLVKIVSTIKPPFYFFLAFYFSVSTLSTDAIFGKVIHVVLIVWIFFQIIHVVQILIHFIAHKYMSREGEPIETDTAVQALNIIAQIALWALGILLILSNIGVDVTFLIAGLGIGGIAVAFAVQGILEDLFSSFTIYFDRPFRVGDFIVVNGSSGTVTKIGIKTTRIKSLQGEEVVIPNQKLTGETVQNYKKMQSRRVSFNFGVEYQTPTKKLAKIPRTVKTIVESQNEVEYGRTHLKTIGEYALMYEVVYTMTNSDFNLYMDTQQSINLAILQAFEQQKIRLAYPTQTIKLKQKDL